MLAEMQSFFGDRASHFSECEIVHRGGELVVSYKDEDAAGKPINVIYRGKASRPGQWLLTGSQPNFRATLSLSLLDKCVLEGQWMEGSDRGMWIVKADEELDILLRIVREEE